MGWRGHHHIILFDGLTEWVLGRPAGRWIGGSLGLDRVGDGSVGRPVGGSVGGSVDHRPTDRATE